MRAIRIAIAAVAAVLAAPAPPAHAAFPGQNGAIAWTHPTGVTADSEVFVMRPDGSGKRPLTDNVQNDFNPAWSPDGRSIAYESSSATDVDILILDAGGERNLTNDGGKADRYPAWSPDGSRLAFSRQSPFTGDGAIWVIDADGGNARRLTSSDSVNEQPAWSPDGRSIAFVSDRDGTHHLYVVNPDGSGLRRVTASSGVQEGNPNWAPNGSRLAYDVCLSATFPCPGTAPDYEIATVNPDGSGFRRLTVVPGIDANPAYSPDGTKVAFRSDRTGFTEIWTMNADGSNPTQLTFKDFQGGTDPDWQPLPG